MSEMMERVAFATCSMQPCICKNKAGFAGMPCLDRARAAFQALWEPTDEMIEAGWENGMAGFGEGEECRPVWQAMLEAARK